MTKIVTCTCNHAYQDSKYGDKKRVANKASKGFRCTVCGRDHSVK